MIIIFICCLVSCIFSILGVYALTRSLKQMLMDIPNERSSHTQPTPRGGGIGFILAFAVSVQLNQGIFNDPTISFSYPLWLPLVFLVGIGYIDDWKTLSSRLRYTVQLLVACMIVWQGNAFPQPWLESLGGVGTLLAISTTILGLTALINFYNFMDGMDGLVAGVSTVQLGFMAVWSQEPILWLLVSALVGFLYWNWSPAKIFMGDVGSTFLGAVMAITLLSQTGTTEHIWSALAITLPITGDAIYTLLCRTIRRENIFKAHRSHIYQRLHQVGWSHSKVAALYMSITLTMAIFIHAYEGVGAWMSLIGIAIAILCTERYLSTRKQQTSH